MDKLREKVTEEAMPHGVQEQHNGDRGTFIAAPLQRGGFLTSSGVPVTQLAPPSSSQEVYKSHHVLNANPLCDNNHTGKSSRTSADENTFDVDDNSPDDSEEDSTSGFITSFVRKYPSIVAGISVCVLAVLAAVLVGLLLSQI
ncbi:hypothetical protein F7230_06750 [Corynebacterium sp. 320]|uniref:hypothetical protein n=1 Tax=Corynebacterium TaxID=1716 RepID=UPI00125CC185|nr:MULTISPECIES: hypothetical protein [Corynebacterium]KAB1502714.1 hypothetical protein F7230_06750 [Corynebacterium sp. 320]KAB1550548.1 hypothetical protein F7232_09760 [Corynebacterium sp. 319]KAB1554725.1 hypothetical protein F7233_00065 [Corynebacterium sp. 321]KAB3526377.1 hypothetical protein F8354_06750 [Corynebacterium sp. 250]KAB3537778.1 hypothetical protein F8390_09730 [Corynebacterium sp. 366]